MRTPTSEDLTLFADSMDRILGDLYDPVRRAALTGSPDGFSEENWNVFSEAGWLGAMFAERDGGYGDGIQETLLLFERVGAALVLEPLLDCVLLSGQVLAAIGGDTARAALGDIIEGRSRTVLLAAGPDSSPNIMATQENDHWRLSGTNAVVRWAPAADRLLVHASYDGGSALFLVGSSVDGVKLTNFKLVDGSRASQITLEDVTVPLSGLVATGTLADAAVGHGYALATLAICSEAVGAMDRCVWMTRDYLKDRRQFGQPLSSFQALQHRMADMLIELELAGALVRRAGHELATLNPAERDRLISACKVAVARAGQFASANAIQLHGGIGVTDEYVIGHYFKRLLVIEQQFGNADTHLERFIGA